SRDGTRRHGSVLSSVDGRRSDVTRIRTELSHSVCNEPASQRGCANCRSGPRLQKVERVSDPQALAFEIRRAGRSCFEEGTLKPTCLPKTRPNNGKRKL